MKRIDELLGASPELQVQNRAHPISRRDWEEAVGTRIARRAEPVRLERGVLTVRTATAVWANELSLLADGILAQLRARQLPIESLRFVVGGVTGDGRARLPVRHAPPRDAAVPEALVPALQEVADPELRAVLASAAAKSLALERASTERQPSTPPSSRSTRNTKRG